MQASASGLLVVDKAGGMTSHDVVARIRRLAGTRRVGHAGTLDPMATGVLVVGIEQATRLLGYLSATTKQYAATIRLGQATSTDDADGDIVARSDAAGLTGALVRAAVSELTGKISQVPPGISAVKVGGARAYRLTRAGTAPVLAARTVNVHAIDVLAIRNGPAADGGREAADSAGAVADRGGALVDVDISVTCSSGTYIRAIARDLGIALGVGGHLTALRRTRAGRYEISDARTLEQLSAPLRLIPLAEAAAAAFPRLFLSAADAARMAHGIRISTAAAGPGSPAGMAGPVAAFGPDGSLVALVTETDGCYRSLAVFAH